MVGAGIRTTGTVIPSETMAAHSVAMEQTYRTGNGKLGRGKPPLATAAVAVAVSTTTPPAVAPLPISVAAPDIDVSKQKTAEARRLKTLIMSNLLGGGISS